MRDGRRGGQPGQRERCESEGENSGGLATSGHGWISFDTALLSGVAISKLAARKGENPCSEGVREILMVPLRSG
ncbi:hypothetical protein GCM10010284_61850 [Streptomyces rubiginosohelvolus]|uniref:Uncharacterized protein n=1 Tax=Streptomyces rubiginosohelvolus TaxID=67362 RepID=A0ABQ3BWH1_9ACTN|nr:hypothetical protein GCM10010284_61850 [Streptomyces rubiginosohelvolus]GGZ59775.1 hypothetical protein GCM10010328_38250 [Streptomyces pluricolorescens]